MKISSTMLVILALQAMLLISIYSAVAEHGVGESKAIDINPNPPKCCDNCNFLFSGLYHCDDVVKKCDHNCKNCTQVHAYPRTFQCHDTYIGVCGPPCKKH